MYRTNLLQVTIFVAKPIKAIGSQAIALPAAMLRPAEVAWPSGLDR